MFLAPVLRVNIITVSSRVAAHHIFRMPLIVTTGWFLHGVRATSNSSQFNPCRVRQYHMVLFLRIRVLCLGS